MKLLMLSNYRGKLTDEKLLCKGDILIGASSALIEVLLTRNLAQVIHETNEPETVPQKETPESEAANEFASTVETLPDDATRDDLKAWLDAHDIPYNDRARLNTLRQLYEDNL